MYLKRVETSGFKSFANKTDLDFPKGVTAIVGPNGSGKSNIADAVKWVLGEQSMKSLRGKKSEDVIFTGSNKKAKMSAAVVSLFLDNRDKKIPIDFDEVILTRKLFRNGDSEYLINKNRARLSDIVDLLVRSGVSQRGYCVINQGMADSILAASPAERMVIFEEATGVRRFQIKKNQTIKKIDSTRRNLIRVTELLAEIEPRLNFLKRQAGKAAIRGEVERDLKDKQEKLFSNIWIKLNQDNKKFRIQKEELENFINSHLKEIGEIKTDLSKNENKNNDDGVKFEELRAEMDSVQASINELRKNLSIAEGRIEIEHEKKEKAENPEFVPINLGYVKEKLSNILSIYESILVFLGNSAESLNLVAAKSKAGEVKELINSLFVEIKEGRVSQNHDMVKFDDSRLNSLESEKMVILGKIDQFSRKYEEIRTKISDLNREEQEKRRAFFDLERSLQRKQDELGRFKDNLNGISIELAKFEVRKEDLINEIRGELGGGSELLGRIESNTHDEKVDLNEFNQEELRSAVRRLKVQFEQIGGIDPLVVEEYEETKKRFEFLSSQLKDLEEAIESLKMVIKELEEKIESRFKSSFKNINEEFDRYFKIIFAGGKAGLTIKYEAEENETEAEDEAGSSEENDEPDGLAEIKNGNKRIAGIEISVAPPGKKISSLDMLSGGERALTSIAVLFAIIANNPPPFSVLDEIDAALDEANSEKLSVIIKEVSAKTQFIVITHNREMMRQADILYGVTMQNDGVSKIISIKLEDIKEK